jgi:hypothetical protein
MLSALVVVISSMKNECDSLLCVIQVRAVPRKTVELRPRDKHWRRIGAVSWKAYKEYLTMAASHIMIRKVFIRHVVVTSVILLSSARRHLHVLPSVRFFSLKYSYNSSSFLLSIIPA